MTYMEYLNQFHRWRENGNPGDKLIVLYLNMLDMFNQRYWPEWAGVTTQQLMVLANTENKKSALNARDRLVRAGFLKYRPGKKGKATTYKLLRLGCESATENDTENKNGCESATENDTGNDTETATKNSPPIKTKTNTKTKTLSSASSPTTTPTTTESDAVDLSSSADAAWTEVMTKFLNFIPGASASIRQQMTEYYYLLGAEVCLRALDVAKDAEPIAKNKLAYLFGILKNRKVNGIRSLEAWDAHERERSQGNRNVPAQFAESGRQKSAEELSAELERELFGYDD